MKRYLGFHELLKLYEVSLQQFGGTPGLHNLHALRSASAQPRLTFDQQELYSTIAEKASSLVFALVRNHPFVDGNRRVGHAAMETFLVLNGFEIDAPDDEQESVITKLASSELEREHLTEWIREHLVKTKLQNAK